MFKVESQNPKAPVYQGDITITKNDMRLLVEAVQANKDVKMKVAAFRREGRKGPFLSLALTEWSVHEKEQADWKAKNNQGGDFDAPAPQGNSDPWDEGGEVPF